MQPLFLLILYNDVTICPFYYKLFVIGLSTENHSKILLRSWFWQALQYNSFV